MRESAALDDARRALLAGLIDHAPMFPPARLPLEEALEDHRRALASPHGWMVSRFVCPASRLTDLPAAPIRISAVLDTDGPVDDERVEAVEARLGVELPATTAGEVFVEIAADGAVEETVTQLRRQGLFAKVRCGGDRVPSAEELGRFVRACRGAGVPFKATAGLHHAFPTGGEHGFLNLLAAAVFGDEEEVLASGPDEINLDGERLRWREQEAGPDELARVRRELFVSIGSCSFFEPAGELEALGVLPA